LSPNLNLTRGQKAKLAAGEPVPITGTGQCTVEKGHVEYLPRGATLRVLRVDPHHGGWKLHYELTVREEARLLRRTPPAAVVTPDRRAPTPDIIQRAAQDSAYTERLSGLVDEAGQAVDEGTQQRFAKEAQEGFGAHLERERNERKARRLDERLRNVQVLADRRGVDLSRKLASIERRIESAEREVGREDAA
jgi:hypothetical protein